MLGLLMRWPHNLCKCLLRQTHSAVQLEGKDSALTQQLFLTVHLASATPSGAGGLPPEGAYAATCTRCLRVPNGTNSIPVDEAFLLEVPDAVARALARDVSAEATAHRLHLSAQKEHALQQGVQVIVMLHDQAATEADSGLLASGAWDVPADWLRRQGLPSAQTSQAGASEHKQHLSAGHSIKLQPADAAGGRASTIVAATVGAQAQLQRVSMWLGDDPAPSATQAGGSQRGYRSLRLAGPGSPWLPVVRDGMQQRATGSSALSGSVLGLSIASGVALEESFAHGLRQETIRSTVQVANDLDFAVQVTPCTACTMPCSASMLASAVFACFPSVLEVPAAAGAPFVCCLAGKGCHTHQSHVQPARNATCCLVDSVAAFAGQRQLARWHQPLAACGQARPLGFHPGLWWL